MEFVEFFEQQTATEQDIAVYEWAYDTKTERFKTRNGRMYKVEGREALEIWCYKVLKTERMKHECYSNQYGTTFEMYIGRNMTDIVKETMKHDIEQALSIHPLIVDVSVTSMEQQEDVVHIELSVILDDEGEVNFEYGI